MSLNIRVFNVRFVNNIKNKNTKNIRKITFNNSNVQ